MKTEDKSLLIYFVGILTMITMIIGTAYAFFNYAVESKENDISGIAATNIGMDAKVEKIYPIQSETSDNGLVPIEESLSVINSAIDNKCKNDKNEDICQIYVMSIENKSEINLALHGTIYFRSVDNSKIPDLKWGLLNVSTINGKDEYELNEIYNFEDTILDKSFAIFTNKLTIIDEKYEAKLNENTITLKAADENSTDDEKKVAVVIYLAESDKNQATENYGEYVGNFTLAAYNGGITSTFIQ